MLFFISFVILYYSFPGKVCGFRGSPFSEGTEFDESNVAQTYSALLSLAILGDDFGRVKRKNILESLRSLQSETGCYWSQGEGSESDMRFSYCVSAICRMLQDNTVINWDKLGGFIKRSFNMDGALGQGPNDESHGGSTYCAIACLSLANKLWDESVLTEKQLRRLTRWAIQKQDMGFHGRAHKPDDSCYSFWIGGTLKILGTYDVVSKEHLREFLMISQHPYIGGFSKYPEQGAHSDLLHTYFSIAALSLMQEPYVRPVDPALNCSMRASERIRVLKFKEDQ